MRNKKRLYHVPGSGFCFTLLFLIIFVIIHQSLSFRPVLCRITSLQRKECKIQIWGTFSEDPKCPRRSNLVAMYSKLQVDPQDFTKYFKLSIHEEVQLNTQLHGLMVEIPIGRKANLRCITSYQPLNWDLARSCLECVRNETEAENLNDLSDETFWPRHRKGTRKWDGELERPWGGGEVGGALAQPCNENRPETLQCSSL